MPRARSHRGVWIGLAAAAVVVGAVVGFLGWTFNPSSLKPRLVDTVYRATGRVLTISGDMGIRLSLVPTVSMEDVALSNPPGFSRPDMVKIARVELGLALLPLLRHEFEVDHVTLVRPDGVLETDAAGHANWVFTRARPAEAASAPPPPANPPSDTTPKQPFAVSFKDASVVDGRIGFVDGRTRHDYAVDIPRLILTAPLGGPAEVNGALNYEGRRIDLTTRVEPGDPSDAASWPVTSRLTMGDATMTADGQIANPFQGRGYRLSIEANLPDPSILAPFFPRVPVASLKTVTAHADVVDSGAPVPTVSALRVTAKSIDLNNIADGARLEDVTLDAKGDQPIRLGARLSAAGVDSGIGGTIGTLPWLTGGASGPVMVDLQWNAASARGSIKGAIQEPAQVKGIALDLALSVPDPSLVASGAPPRVKAVTFQTHLTDAGGPESFALSSTAGDLTGTLAVARLSGPSPARISVQGQVWSRRLDLDALRERPAETAPRGSPTAAAAPPDRKNFGPVIPDMKLPLDLIRAVDVDVKFNFARLLIGGADVRGIAGVVAAKDGTLRLDPFTIAAPDQRLSGLVVADAAKDPATVHLSLDAPALALRPLLAALGLPQAADGAVAVRADLRGKGDTPRALASSLDGWAGVAIEGGQLDARMVNTWLDALRPLRIGGGDVTDLRCFAIRANARNGVVAIQPIALDTAALIVEGSGDIDLGHEFVSMSLRPRARIGGAGIALPLRVSGPLRAPSARIDISGKGPGGGGIAGLLLGGGKDVMGAAGGGDPCPDALARARDGAADEAPRVPPPVAGGKP